MSQWKRIGNLKIASVIFAVFLIGVLIGSGQSQKVSALSNNMYEDLKVLRMSSVSFRRIMWKRRNQGPGSRGDQGDAGNLRPSFRLHATEHV